MDSQETEDLLDGCLKAATAATSGHPSPHGEADKLHYCSCRASLCAELACLLQEALDMKWPFVPEKWQYKQSVSAGDKTNLNDLISQHLPQLLKVLKAAIVVKETQVALAVIFLVDRFLYWKDESRRLLTITRLLHRNHPEAPVAPQLVIRQARVYLNAGTLQEAEYILSSLINKSGATGCWVYQSDSDKALVQAVSVQVRGQILEKLGLWLEAAELTWASLVGYYALPQPDKKGIGTSLGILANILVSMNDEDFHTFRSSPHIDLSLLGDGSHRLLSAAEAARMAVVFSQYTALYVLTNAAIQGTCLLSYSFSVECPSAERHAFRLQAKEAFEIGLLTKAEGEMVTSKQELHTFLKAAYSLAVTHKWLGASPEVVTAAQVACQKALAHFYDYCHADTQEKDSFCVEIMQLIDQVKVLLQVEPFPNSDKASFIPDSYRSVKDQFVNFTLEGFSVLIQRFQKYHASLSDTSQKHCKGATEPMDGAGLCMTAFGTTVGTLNTECSTEMLKDAQTAGKEPNQSCPSTETNDNDLVSKVESTGKSTQGYKAQRPMSSTSVCTSDNFAVIESPSQALASTEDCENNLAGQSVPTTGNEEAPQSLSQLILRTTSSSLSNSFGSLSSWDRLSADLMSPTDRVPPDAKGGSLPSCKSSDTSESFFWLGTPDSGASDSAHNPTGTVQNDKSKPGPLGIPDVDQNPNPKDDSANEKHLPMSSKATPKFKHSAPDEYPTTEPPTENSFEMLEMYECMNIEAPCTKEVPIPEEGNPQCYSCLNHATTAPVDPVRQYLLSLQDYQSLLAGVCHQCLLKRLQSDKHTFQLKKDEYESAYNALHLKFSKASGLWTARETCVYIGQPMKKKGKQRSALWVQFLHQEERLSSYVGKDYLDPMQIQFHLKDVERQMTAQYYVTEFNKSLYEKEVMAPIFFIPSEALLMLNGNKIVGCVTVEPYMLGSFVKLTNNKEKKNTSLQATEYGLAFGHFTYQFSGRQEIVVDLQGWVTDKGLTYLTDPQIHSIKTAKGRSNFADRGIKLFLEEQHGPKCNKTCQLLKLPPVTGSSVPAPQKSQKSVP